MISDSEMSDFIRYFAYIFRFLVPVHDDVWDLFPQSRDLVEIVVSPNVTLTCCASTSSYWKLPGVLLESGPCWKMGSMRCGSKHREGKVASRVAIRGVKVPTMAVILVHTAGTEWNSWLVAFLQNHQAVRKRHEGIWDDLSRCIRTLVIAKPWKEAHLHQCHSSSSVYLRSQDLSLRLLAR